MQSRNPNWPAIAFIATALCGLLVLSHSRPEPPAPPTQLTPPLSHGSHDSSTHLPNNQSGDQT